MMEAPELRFIFGIINFWRTHHDGARQRNGNYELLGTTLDDAVGEAFDKTAVSQFATPVAKLNHWQKGITGKFDFPRPLKNKNCDFSFSGLKLTFCKLGIRQSRRIK